MPACADRNGAGAMRAPARPRAPAALSVGDFERVEIPFLNPSIRTSQAMVWFQDRVVLGTGRAPLGFLGRFTGREDQGAGGERADTGGREEDGAQILTFDPAAGHWEKIYDSPLVSGRDGGKRARD